MSSLKNEIRQDRGFESLEQEILLNLMRTASVMSAPFDRMLKSAGLSHPLYNILRILRGQKGTALSCSGIGERMVTRDSDITRLIDRMVKMDLVERVRCEEDRRVVLTSITEKGLAALGELDEPMRELHLECLEHLSIEDKTELNRLLEKARNPQE